LLIKVLGVRSASPSISPVTGFSDQSLRLSITVFSATSSSAYNRSFVKLQSVEVTCLNSDLRHAYRSDEWWCILGRHAV